jgi:heat shock protein 4
MEDCDLNHTLPREQYEKMITPVINKLKDTLTKINTSKYTIHSVELVGGATRIPLIQKTIQDTYGQTLLKTLNTTECIARGAAIQAAIVSPLFKVSDYLLEEANYYPIRCSWKFLESPQAYSENKMDIEDARNNPIKQRSILFDTGSNVPSVKAVSFHKEDAVEFKLFYDPVPIGAQELLATYLIHNPKPQNPDFKVKLRVHLNRDGVVEFDSSQLIEEWEEEEPAPKEGDKKDEGSASQEPPKKKKKSRSTDLKTDIIFRHGLTQSQINQHFEEECQMANNDRVIHETYHKKNELESYIYDFRGKIADKYKKYVDNATAETFMNQLAENEQWLYADGLKTTKAAYTTKLEGLKKLGDPIEKRAQEYEQIPEHVQNLITLVDNVDQTLAPNNEKLAHVTAEDRKPVLDLAAQIKAWAFNALSAVEKTPTTKNPPITISEIQQKFHELQNKATPVINKPKPEPPKEPKKEEKTEEPKKSDEMKDEKEEKSDAKMDIEK